MDPLRKKRKVVTHEGRAVIVKLYKYLSEEYIYTMMYKDCKCDLSHLRSIARRTADATNVTIKTVAEILKENKEINDEKNDNKVYRFQKTKQSKKIVRNEKMLRKELELVEAAILAEAIEKDIKIEGKDNIEKILGPLERKEGEDISENTLQQTNVKIEDEDEQIKWERTVIKTESEEEEVIWREEEGIPLEDVDIKDEPDDYEITIKEERIG